MQFFCFTMWGLTTLIKVVREFFGIHHFGKYPCTGNTTMPRISCMNQDHTSFPYFTMLYMIGLAEGLIFDTMFNMWDVMRLYRVKCYCSYRMGKHGIWVNLNTKWYLNMVKPWAHKQTTLGPNPKLSGSICVGVFLKLLFGKGFLTRQDEGELDGMEWDGKGRHFVYLQYEKSHNKMQIDHW